jgi:hypothetical protein
MAFNKGGVKGKSPWKPVGEILKSKAGKLYVKFKEDFTVEAGSTLMIQDPRVNIQEGVTAGRMTEEQAEERLAKIPEFVRYNLILPPSKE